MNLRQNVANPLQFRLFYYPLNIIKTKSVYRRDFDELRRKTDGSGQERGDQREKLVNEGIHNHGRGPLIPPPPSKGGE